MKISFTWILKLKERCLRCCKLTSDAFFYIKMFWCYYILIDYKFVHCKRRKINFWPVVNYSCWISSKNLENYFHSKNSINSFREGLGVGRSPPSGRIFWLNMMCNILELQFDWTPVPSSELEKLCNCQTLEKINDHKKEYVESKTLLSRRNDI